MRSQLNYRPTPIDTSQVELPREVLDLTEALARNAHEIWAAQRFATGWTHGSVRDDNAKTHPCLVPYDSLPESEREFDRETALGTLKAIIALGFRIEKAA